VTLFNSTPTADRCGGIFCCFRRVSHCMSPINRRKKLTSLANVATAYAYSTGFPIEIVRYTN